MQFTRLRLTGFKSFVDPTELLILPGLTGVVGPNGCGKSNLVEALRWVMGENSAKQMRGGEMDDVIFGGTAFRPARNVAEVALSLRNDKLDASGPYNTAEDIDVSRRIERHSGSVYRINGKDARARDVQLLFADAQSGARSTSLVSQGQIGAIIGAKPTQRRHLLEEAAGITGLHTRRHEAELRMNAAEGNLQRLEDLIGTLQSQLQGLKKQARQAARYRSINDRIRKAEAAKLFHQWQETESAVEIASAESESATEALTDCTRRAAGCAAAQAEAAAALPGLRQAEAEAGAAVHHLNLARERLDDRIQRVQQEIDSIKRQSAQIDGDIAREESLREDAIEATARMDGEARALRQDQDGEAASLADSAAALQTANHNIETLEHEAARHTDIVSKTEAERAASARRVEDLSRRAAAIRSRLAELEQQCAQLRALTDTPNDEAQQALQDQEDARAAVAAARAYFDQAQADSSTAEHGRDHAETAQRLARDQFDDAQARHARLAAEVAALEDLLASAEQIGTDVAPILDQLTVAAGYETALGTALGDDLAAADDDGNMPIFWRDLGAAETLPPLPAGTTPMTKFVNGPASLQRRLSQIGVIAADDGFALQRDLHQGQRLVSGDGRLWRWDGLVVQGDVPSAAAARLKQRNRLADLKDMVTESDAALATAEADLTARNGALTDARQACEGARAAEAAARKRYAEAQRALDHATERHSAAAETHAKNQSRLDTLTDSLVQLRADQHEHVEQLDAAEHALASLPDPDHVREPRDAARARLAAARATRDELARNHDRLTGEANTRRHRLDDIARETSDWARRRDGAGNRLTALGERRDNMAVELARLSAEPTKIDAERQVLFDKMEQVEDLHGKAADVLARAEAHAAECDRALRSANEALAAGRETKARTDGRLEQATSLRDVEVQRLRERLDCAPDQALAIAEIAAAEDLPSIEDIDRRLSRLMAERDGMGAVNLRAEEEARELGERIDGLETERADLIAAITRLRAAIGSLNREGRQRLLDAFDKVNAHFQPLFVRLFGGGRAHLSLVGDEDPLQAGLEILASPPGKRLQNLSLLSGGEKALAALSLLFAVFLTKPAPICVLDEVDAPLDDSNVDRFCDLLTEIAHSAQTRFLVITHHRLTMARVDRLFGVTMSERGISKLVSVDLGDAEHLQAAE